MSTNTKRIISFTLFASVVLVGSSSAALIAHYTLDETSGTTAADSSGNGNDMVWQTTGTPGWMGAGGVAGGSFNFTGTDDDAFMTTGTISQSIPVTMSVWVNTASTANDTLVYVGNGSTNNSYYTTKIQSGAVRVVARNTAEVNTGGGTVNNSAWHHVASVYVSDTERLIYVDGVLGGTNTVAVPSLTATRFGIGALTRGSGPVDEFTGMLDDVQIYDQVLDATQIAFLQANPGLTVPEPSAAVLLALALGAGLARRRRA